MTLREKIKQMPVLGRTTKGLWHMVRPIVFRLAEFHSPNYWDARYAAGGNSGAGSYGNLATFKANVLNHFVAENRINSVIEFGCGDGNQLSLSRYPQYLGLDISPRAVERCRERFRGDRSKRFAVYDHRQLNTEKADLALSLDVIYHLVEDPIYLRHMQDLFDAATRFVVIYSDNQESPRDSLHVRHRRFSGWIEQSQPSWQLVRHIPNKYPPELGTQLGSWADFWIYGKEYQPAKAKPRYRLV
jgi:SAM-dependent methyltransferase